MYRILIYKGSLNLGDAIQTYAMARLLPGLLEGVYRNAASDSLCKNIPFVVNGWLGERTPDDPNCLFAGVYLGRSVDDQLRWIRGSRFGVVGARDNVTKALLAKNGIESEAIGCATMTLPRYDGPRKGVLNVDVGEFEKRIDAPLLTNVIPPGLEWAAQWRLAIERLEALRTAELVYTKRLHVALPCLAFGTPVVVPKRVLKATFQPDRLRMLEDLGIEYDKPFTLDMTPHAERFKAFLADALGVLIEPKDNPEIPLPA